MLVEGQEVWLKESDNGDGVVPREHGVIVELNEMPWGLSVVVQLDEEYREPEGDDGLREITVDQIEEPMVDPARGPDRYSTPSGWSR